MTFKKIIFLLSIPTISCHLKDEGIDKLWFYTYSSDVTNNDSTLTPTTFINLEKSGAYTANLGDFSYGKWKYNDHRLQLTDNKKTTSLIKVKFITEKQLQLVFDNATQVDYFESQPLSSEKKSPFSLENNFWQIRADAKESNMKIKSRLLNHLKFWELYFTWALENDIQSIDVRSMPTLIKIYGNGFTLKSYDTLPAKWKSFFYDTVDCRKANDMIEFLLSKNDLSWPHTDNKYAAFISVFQQMQIKLRALDVTSIIAHS
jgi:hypothetical protein